MIKIVAAMSLDRAIGVYPENQKKGKLPWSSNIAKGDLEYFHKITKDSVVIMGRKTFESIESNALSDRINMVITSKNISNSKNLFFINSFYGAIAEAKTYKKDINIIGGADIYKAGLEYAEEIILTVIPFKAYEEYSPKELVYFPDVGENFRRIGSQKHPVNSNLLLIKYQRNKNGVNKNATR